jgi:Xaa-Pro aminopeptidase
VVNGDKVIYGMRLIKSPLEVQALRKVWQVCDRGYKAILDADLVGMTEIQAAALGEKAARDAGAEQIVFSIFASGPRTDTVIGRATEKVIQKGEMVMACLAVQYDGYIASDEWPFVAGGKPTADQLDLIRYLIVAEDLGIKMVKDGVVAGQVVAAIRDYFAANGLTKYDLYPPIHGNGLAEAESPYPDEHTTYTFKSGMGVNFDVSLFGLPGVGSNRVEEGFVVDAGGMIVLSDLISGLRIEFLKRFA